VKCGLGSGSGFTVQARAFAGQARLGVWVAGLAQKPGPRGLGLLGYVVKARARLGPLQP
jgi:hypothetical protein